MSKWQRVSMMQSHPQDIGNDSAGRVALRFNFMATKEPSATAEEEVVKLLVAAGVGVFGTNIFSSSASVLPTGAGPYLLITDTGGPSGIYQHNEAKPAYSRATFAITVYAKSFVAARAMWHAAYDALSVVVNQTVTP